MPVFDYAEGERRERGRNRPSDFRSRANGTKGRGEGGEEGTEGFSVPRKRKRRGKVDHPRRGRKKGRGGKKKNCRPTGQAVIILAEKREGKGEEKLCHVWPLLDPFPGKKERKKRGKIGNGERRDDAI